MNENRGFFHNPDADPQQYVYGANSPIVAPVIEADRDWTDALPTYENQLQNGFDPASCASYGSLNLIEMYIRRVFGKDRNYSDRWLAFKTGTKDKHGNDPHFVLEFIRKAGDVSEREWPFLTSIVTYDGYYTPPPRILDTEALDFFKEWQIQHDTVRQGSFPTLQDAMWDALQYSPLGVSVGFNALDEYGYYKNGSMNDWHWTTIVGGVYGHHWLIFDSFDSSLKKANWAKLQPQLVKRVHVAAAVGSPTYSLLDQLKAALKAVLALFTRNSSPMPVPQTPATPPKQPQDASPAPTPTIPAPAPKPGLLTGFCTAIRDYEGKPGDRNYRNNNPGNCRYSSVGYDPSYGHVGRDAQNFAIFKDYDTGWRYLNNLVKEKVRQHPDKTIYEFMQVYAPVADGNDPLRYAQNIAKHLGVTIDYPMANIVA